VELTPEEIDRIVGISCSDRLNSLDLVGTDY